MLCSEWARSFPHFSLVASVGANEHRAFRTITDRDFPGQWKIYFFWPKNFTDLSLAEILDFGGLGAEFRATGTPRSWDAASNPSRRTSPGASRKTTSANLRYRRSPTFVANCVASLASSTRAKEPPSVPPLSSIPLV